MKKQLLNLISLILLALLLSACGEGCRRECDANGEHCRRDCGDGQFECVEADDWGDPKVWVPAGTDDMPPGSVTGGYPDQSARAVDSNQLLVDAGDVPLVISVGKRNQWTSWFSGKDNPKTPNGIPDPEGWDGGRIVPNRECQYQVTHGNAPTAANAPLVSVFSMDLSPSTIWANKDHADELHALDIDNNYTELMGITPADTNDSGNVGALSSTFLEYANSKTPCNFRAGMGLYIGLANDDGRGTSSAEDVTFTYHIPDAKLPGTPFDPNIGGGTPTGAQPSGILADAALSNTNNANLSNRGMDGYLVRGLADDKNGHAELPNAETGDKLFFKIVDRYYNDNEGGYLVRIKSGTRSTKMGPLEAITHFILDPVRVIMHRMYLGIVENQSYINAVRLILALYVMAFGYGLIMGMNSAQEAKKDAYVRIFKICIILMFISPGSWDFFNNHLFSAFTDGIMQIAGLLMSPFDDYDPKSPWFSMDRLLAKFFSGETAAKIFSTLFSNFPLGILYVPILYLAMILFIIALVKALMLYVVSFIAMAILIVLAPIFIIGMLFERTKNLMSEWWNQMVSYSIQQLLLFTALGMFAAIILTYMERTIGYTVCWNTFADIDFIGVNAEMPVSSHIINLQFWMPDISKDMSNIWMDVNGDGRKEFFPPEQAFRYTDLPYFDPVYDKDVIARYMREKDFLNIIDLMIFILAIILMMGFMDFIPKMSESLKGGSLPQDTGDIGGPTVDGKHQNTLMDSVVGTAKLGGSLGAGLFGEGVSAVKGAWSAGKKAKAANRAASRADKIKRNALGTSTMTGNKLRVDPETRGKLEASLQQKLAGNKPDMVKKSEITEFSGMVQKAEPITDEGKVLKIGKESEGLLGGSSGSGFLDANITKSTKAFVGKPPLPQPGQGAGTGKTSQAAGAIVRPGLGNAVANKVSLDSIGDVKNLSKSQLDELQKAGTAGGVSLTAEQQRNLDAVVLQQAEQRNLDAVTRQQEEQRNLDAVTRQQAEDKNKSSGLPEGAPQAKLDAEKQAGLNQQNANAEQQARQKQQKEAADKEKQKAASKAQKDAIQSQVNALEARLAVASEDAKPGIKADIAKLKSDLSGIKDE